MLGAAAQYVRGMMAGYLLVLVKPWVVKQLTAAIWIILKLQTTLVILQDAKPVERFSQECRGSGYLLGYVGMRALTQTSVK
jgi:hypothetical protein